MKLSIIVPVYKAEAYLNRCVDSLLAQTLENYEIILVNDGSPDASQAMIDTYVSRFPEKIRALEISNGGQGRARNFGIGIARGEYLGFVDSDDWIEPDMYARMVALADTEAADVVVCALEARYEDGRREYLPAWREGVPIAAAGSSSNKLFRRSAVGEIRFPEGLWYEDFDFSAKLLMKSRKTVYIPEPLYLYRCGQTSTMHNNNAEKNLDMLSIMEDIRSFMNQGYGSRDEWEFMVINHVLLDSINRLSQQKGDGRKAVIRLMRDYVRNTIPELHACQSYQQESRNRRIVMDLNYRGLESLSRMLLNMKKSIQ